MKKITEFFCISVFLLFIASFPQRIFASNILFQDNFDDGNADGWEEHLGTGGSWIVQNGEYIGQVNQNSPNPTYALAGDINWANYIFELKIKGISSVDKGVHFRYRDESEYYTLNLRSSPYNDLAIGKMGQNGWMQIIPNVPNIQGTWYDIKVVVEDNNIKVYVDDMLKFDFTDNDNPILSGRIALGVWQGATAPVVIDSFDDVKVTSIDEIPTFPYFSQNDPNSDWYDDPYDHLEGAFMADRGCAVTSAAMVLKYYGVTHTPGNLDTELPPKELNPGTLNEWMISRNDSAFRNGSTNWELIQNMTKYRNDIDPSSPKLVYRNGSSSNIDSLLNNGTPVILDINYPQSISKQHFVVATNLEGQKTAINDPLSPDRKTFEPEYGTIDKKYEKVNQIWWYEPTNSDFSALILAIDPEVTIQLVDQNENELGNIFIQNPIADVVNDTNNESPLRMLWFKEPPTGTYTLTISAGENQQYQLDTYIYDVNGDGGLQTTTGVVGSDDTDTYTISLNHESADDSTVEQPATFESLRNDLNTAYELGWITNRGIYRSFLSLVNVAEKISNKGFNSVAVRILTILSKLLGRFNGKFVTQEGYDLLAPQIDSLISSL